MDVLFENRLQVRKSNRELVSSIRVKAEGFIKGLRDISLTSSPAFVRTKALLVIPFRGRRTETVLPIKIQKCFTCSDCHLLYMAIYFYCEKFMGAFVNVRI